MNAIKLTSKVARPITDQVFPDYKGRKFSVDFTNSVTFFDTNWGGGTRNKYAAIGRDGQKGTFTAPAPWVNPLEGQTIELTPDVIIVEWSIFCGKDLGLTIYAHPDHAKTLIGNAQ